MTEQRGRRQRLVHVLQQNWRAEKESARIYRQLAARESDPVRRDIFARLADAEERHAERWAERLRAMGEPLPPERRTWGDRWRAAVLGLMGPREAALRLETREEMHVGEYGHQGAAGVEEVWLHDIMEDERHHAHALRAIARSAGPGPALAALLGRETWHHRGGSWIGDAVYGVNDGLGAVFGIVSGVAGYSGGGHIVLISGLAGMLASALSMGSGAYLAAKSEREMHEAQLARERQEMEEDPEHEREEMELFYQLKGFTEEEARQLVDRLLQMPERFLEVMAQEELGLSEGMAPSPGVSAASAALSTAIGALIPIIPFFWLQGVPAIVTASAVSLVAHFAVGAAKSLFTMRPWWHSGLEMTVVGAVEGAITFVLGLLAGGAVH